METITIKKEIESSMAEAVQKIQSKMSTTSKAPSLKGPEIYKRDEHGLLCNVDYAFNEDGSVDWRSMIKEEHLFPNKGWFETRKKSVPRTIEGLKDHQLLIKLSGIKELAKLRGFSDCYYDVVKCEENHVAVKCSITFTPNYETRSEPTVFSDMANATLNNTSNFATKFLETIACNRAFVRCVRNFLNVHIVGDDEIDKSDSSNSVSTISKSSSLSPQGILKDVCLDLGFSSFDDFKNKLREWHTKAVYIIPDELDPKSWLNFEDIPAKQAREFLKIVKQ